MAGEAEDSHNNHQTFADWLSIKVLRCTASRLGLQLEEQLAGQEEGVTPAIAAAWAATEAKRDAMQWLPTRAPPAPPASPG